MQIWEVSSNTRRRTLPEFQIPRALKMLAFGSPFQKALGIWNPGKVLRLVFELLLQKLISNSWAKHKENQYHDGDFIPDKVWSSSGMTIDLISSILYIKIMIFI